MGNWSVRNEILHSIGHFKLLLFSNHIPSGVFYRILFLNSNVSLKIILDDSVTLVIGDRCIKVYLDEFFSLTKTGSCGHLLEVRLAYLFSNPH